MKELIKRMAEIRSRKVELRGVLETDAKADLDAIEKELRELDEEYTNLEKRKAVIEGIGAGTVPVNEVPNPINNRSADNFDQDKEYRSAWLKHVRGLDLTENEQRALTTGTSSAGAVIPTVTQNKIIEKVNQYCPLLDKIDLLRVPGGAKVPAEGTTADAAVQPLPQTATLSRALRFLLTRLQSSLLFQSPLKKWRLTLSSPGSLIRLLVRLPRKSVS